MPVPDKSTIASYGVPVGGFLDTYPVRNPTTDQPAAGANASFADTAGLTRTGLRAWAIFTTAATTGALVLNAWDAMWGGVVPPVASPTLARTSAGVFTITWPTIVGDEINSSAIHTVSFQRINTIPLGATLFFAMRSVSVNVATVYTFNAAGSANDMVGSQVYVECG